MRASLGFVVGAMSVLTISYAAPVSAENLKSVVRTLNAIINPEDAWRLEDQARRFHQPADERYWHSYGAGLEQQHHEQGGPQYGAPGRYTTPIDPDEARRLEDQARRYGHRDEGNYWSRYGEGLGGPAGPPR